MEVAKINEIAKDSNQKRVLLKQKVTAGFNTVHDEASGEKIDLNKHLMPNKFNSYLMRVIGDSMIDAGINPGDEIIVDTTITPTNNSIVVATVNGEFTVKRLKIVNPKRLMLIAENPYYTEPMISEDLNIWGVVTKIISSLN